MNTTDFPKLTEKERMEDRLIGHNFFDFPLN